MSANGVLEDDVEERTLWVMRRGPHDIHPDTPALELASYVLSYGRGTRLDEKLELKGVASSNDAFLYPGEIDGQFGVLASSERTSLKKLEKVLRSEVSKLATRAPREAEVERSLKAIRASLLNRLEDPAERAQFMVDCQRRRGDPNCLGNDFAEFEAVTPEDIRDAVARWLSGPSVTLSVVPRGDDGALSGATLVELP